MLSLNNYKKIFFALFVFTIIASAQDVEGSKDHPLLTRYPDSTLLEYAKDNNSVEFAIGRTADGNPKRKAIEGDRTLLRYFYAEGNQPSPLQIIRNYQCEAPAVQYGER